MFKNVADACHEVAIDWTLEGSHLQVPGSNSRMIMMARTLMTLTMMVVMMMRAMMTIKKVMMTTC